MIKIQNSAIILRYMDVGIAEIRFENLKDSKTDDLVVSFNLIEMAQNWHYAHTHQAQQQQQQRDRTVCCFWNSQFYYN